jgi:hypothetical protein
MHADIGRHLGGAGVRYLAPPREKQAMDTATMGRGKLDLRSGA